MRAAPLHNVQLYGAHLAADIVSHELFKVLAHARKVLVSESVGKLGEKTLSDTDTLRNGNDDSFVPLLRLADIGDELVCGKVCLGKIYHVWSGFSVGSEYA